MGSGSSESGMCGQYKAMNLRGAFLRALYILCISLAVCVLGGGLTNGEGLASEASGKHCCRPEATYGKGVCCCDRCQELGSCFRPRSVLWGPQPQRPACDPAAPHVQWNARYCRQRARTASPLISCAGSETSMPPATAPGFSVTFHVDCARHHSKHFIITNVAGAQSHQL